MHAIVAKYSQQSQRRIAESLSHLREFETEHQWMLELAGAPLSEIARMEKAHQSLRIIYRAAGSIMEESVKACLSNLNGYRPSQKFENLIGNRPKQHEVDCLVGQNAYEIKWRDATTDGDHKSKEIERIKNIIEHGLTPTRLMFFIPQNPGAAKIQKGLRKAYEDLGGHYYCGKEAWDHVTEISGHNLREMLLSAPKIPRALFA